MLLPLFGGRLGLGWLWATGADLGFGRSKGSGFKWHSLGGNAKPTYGILFVTPGRDLFSS
jgi:hypothetical protein